MAEILTEDFPSCLRTYCQDHQCTILFTCLDVREEKAKEAVAASRIPPVPEKSERHVMLNLLNAREPTPQNRTLL